MNDEQRALLERLERFELDAPGASFPFSRKLSAENHWPIDYARRAIQEYKRFAFLAVAAGHPVSPSEAVDQVWHMHLTYSQSYWKEFCPNVLGVPFHHNPSSGGNAERDKFDDWYARTFESYRKFFQGEPPPDIWPSPEEKILSKQDFVRVDKAKHWVIRKPRLGKSWRLAVVSLLSLVVVGCSGAVASSNPLDWRGPQFLQFYLALYVVCLALGVLARFAMRTPTLGGGNAAPTLDGYQLSYLNRGKWLTVDAATASLVRQGAIANVMGTGRFVPAQPLPPDRPHVEQAVYGNVCSVGSVSLAALRTACGPQVEVIGQDLKRQGLVVPDQNAIAIVLLPFLLPALAIIVGAMKVYVGVERERPVAYLIMLVLSSLLISAAVFLRRPLRTRYGDAVMAYYAQRYAHLRHLGHHQRVVAQDDMLLAVGLFGIGSLVGSDLGYLNTTLHPVPQGSSGCGSSTGGCGGSGCGGGGGGCGGGGGGCGGCGGG